MGTLQRGEAFFVLLACFGEKPENDRKEKYKSEIQRVWTIQMSWIRIFKPQ
jgi:hypothetical protein